MSGQAGSDRNVDEMIRGLNEKYGHLSTESPARTKNHQSSRAGLPTNEPMRFCSTDGDGSSPQVFVRIKMVSL